MRTDIWYFRLKTKKSSKSQRHSLCAILSKQVVELLNCRSKSGIKYITLYDNFKVKTDM